MGPFYGEATELSLLEITYAQGNLIIPRNIILSP
jgi:hypothetical protein